MLLPGTYANGFAPRDGQPLYPELWKGCVGAWAPCLGVSGLTLRDQSGFNRHGTLTNGPTWAASSGKYALSFDGSDDYVPTRIITATNQVTFAGWFRPNNVVTYQSICSDANSAGAIINFHMEINLNGKLGLLWGASPYERPEGSTLLSNQVWYHGAVMRSGSSGAWTYKIYLNGKDDGSGSTSVNPGAASTFTIGRPGDASTQYLNATLDDIRIYNRALSPQEIRTLATRRGIAYEMAPRRRSSSAVAVTTNRRRRIIIGGNR